MDATISKSAIDPNLIVIECVNTVNPENPIHIVTVTPNDDVDDSVYPYLVRCSWIDGEFWPQLEEYTHCFRTELEARVHARSILEHAASNPRIAIRHIVVDRLGAPDDADPIVLWS